MFLFLPIILLVLTLFTFSTIFKNNLALATTSGFVFGVFFALFYRYSLISYSAEVFTSYFIPSLRILMKLDYSSTLAVYVLNGVIFAAVGLAVQILTNRLIGKNGIYIDLCFGVTIMLMMGLLLDAVLGKTVDSFLRSGLDTIAASMIILILSFFLLSERIENGYRLSAIYGIMFWCFGFMFNRYSEGLVVSNYVRPGFFDYWFSFVHVAFGSLSFLFKDTGLVRVAMEVVVLTRLIVFWAFTGVGVQYVFRRRERQKKSLLHVFVVAMLILMFSFEGLYAAILNPYDGMLQEDNKSIHVPAETEFVQTGLKE